MELSPIELVLGLFVVAVSLAYLARWIGVAYPILLVLGGLVLGFIPGVPYAYIAFEGEGHGFRGANAIRRTLEARLSFLGQVFGFEPADPIEPLELPGLAAWRADHPRAVRATAATSPAVADEEPGAA